MRTLFLDQQIKSALDRAYDISETLGTRIDDALDAIESDPPDVSVKRRRFAGGQWAVTVRGGGHEWLVIWKETNEEATKPKVLFLGPATSQ